MVLPRSPYVQEDQEAVYHCLTQCVRCLIRMECYYLLPFFSYEMVDEPHQFAPTPSSPQGETKWEKGRHRSSGLGADGLLAMIGSNCPASLQVHEKRQSRSWSA